MRIGPKRRMWAGRGILSGFIGGGIRARWVAATCGDRKSTRLNSSHLVISYAVFCLKKKTHDQSKTFAISDRIFVMNPGRAEQAGTQLELHLRTSTPIVSALLCRSIYLLGRAASSSE